MLLTRKKEEKEREENKIVALFKFSFIVLIFL